MRIPPGVLLFLAATICTAQEQCPFRNPSLPVEQRVHDIVSRMTLPEKIEQMQYAAKAIPRLGIPAYNWWNECLHGVARNGTATVFPQAIGMAATWDPRLVYDEACVISTEARAKHHQAVIAQHEDIYTGLTFWSPNINIFRDPRWGRGQETYGEDPWLTSRIGVAFVKGLQGSDPLHFKVISTPKHFAVHSGPEPARHTFDARTSRRDLFETYLPAFEATITEGGAWSVMGAYNRYMGEACCASDLLLGKTLRGAWSFAGYVVSDCGAIADIYTGHKIVQTPAEASVMAVKAGCDLTCGTEYASLLEAVSKGMITEEEINRSVRRLMTARIRLGMFDPPEADPYASITLDSNNTPGHNALARRVAQESIVLLKNSNTTLPLSKNIRTVAVIGPNANSLDVLLGNYNGTPSHPVTVIEGIKNKLGAARVHYSPGCTYVEGMPPDLADVPASALRASDSKDAHHGLSGLYYDNMTLRGTATITRIDSVVAFAWGTASPDAKMPADSFSVQWTGSITADTTGTYYVGVTVDDGCRLSIDGKLVIDEWHDGAQRTPAGKLFLEAGVPHPLTLQYYEHGGDAICRLGWMREQANPFREAVDAAQHADAVIAVMGLSPFLEGEEMSVSLKGFFGGDRTDIALPHIQDSLLQTLAATGKPLILVLLNGSALAIPWAANHIPSIVEAWYPGQEGGNAVADVLFGDYNPAGRLPVTVYTSTKDLPPFDDYAMKGRTYRYFTGTPLYPFGHGLSYTTFEYQSATADRPSAGPSDTIHVRVAIKNAGPCDGDEVVQLYARARASDNTQPIKSLKAFERIHLAKGESQTVTLALPVAVLRTFNEQANSYVVEPGNYDLQIGASSSDIRANLEILIKQQ